MQTRSSKAQQSGLNKAHFSNTATEKYQKERKNKRKKENVLHTLEKSIQDTKLKSKGLLPKGKADNKYGSSTCVSKTPGAPL